jgi:hypothetical protein
MMGLKWPLLRGEPMLPSPRPGLVSPCRFTQLRLCSPLFRNRGVAPGRANIPFFQFYSLPTFQPYGNHPGEPWAKSCTHGNWGPTSAT